MAWVVFVLCSASLCFSPVRVRTQCVALGDGRCPPIEPPAVIPLAITPQLQLDPIGPVIAQLGIGLLAVLPERPESLAPR